MKTFVCMLLLAGCLAAEEALPDPIGLLTRRPGRDLMAQRQLAEAQRLHAARDPRAAIPIYRSLVSDAPAVIAVSAPAMCGLIACHQMLVGDAAMDADYRTWIGRYLAKPPPLDGVSVPEPEDVREELLWHQLLCTDPAVLWTPDVSEVVLDRDPSASVTLLADLPDLPRHVRF
jgi:hypothetical protein